MPDTPIETPRRSGGLPRRYLLVAATFGLSVLLYVDRVCISIAKEDVSSDLNLTKEQMGWVFAAFTLGYAFFQTPSGWLADRLGPRNVLTVIVSLWSLFTGLTAAATNYVVMLVVRFLFGAGEAGAFPGMARAVFSWIPMSERGMVQGINFSGSRLGAAFALPLIALMIESIGWRGSFVVLMCVGFVWGIGWYIWFRNDPSEASGVSHEELAYIEANRQQPTEASGEDVQPLTIGRMLSSSNLLLIWGQYFASNFTFYFCLSWFFPNLKETYKLTGFQASLYAAAPFVAGAFGNWASGGVIDYLYRSGKWVQSRRLPAIIGFVLAATGTIGSVFADSALTSSIWFCLSIFGADMTLAPSWSTCIDIGKKHAGVVSGSMNMAGNIGSFATSLAFPYLLAWSGTSTPFFFVAAGLNAAAVVMWMMIDPRKAMEASA